MGLSKNLTDKEFYVHVPDPDGYYNIYNPTIKEVPDCKITGEVWIKKPVDLKCIGKIKVLKDTGEAGIPFKYGDKTAELYKWDWKWVDKYDNESINESLETRLTTNIFEKEITIYHGSPTKTSIIYPLSFNAGTKLSKPRMSSFWADERTAKLFGIYRLVQDNNFIISFTPDLRGLLVKPSDYNNIIKLLKSENIYLYEKTLDKKYVGIGHSNYFDEYTVDYPVRPDKIYVLGYNDLKAEISSIDTYNTNDNEKIYKITEKNLNIMLKMNNGIMRKIIANDFQYFRDKSKEYRKGQLINTESDSILEEYTYCNGKKMKKVSKSAKLYHGSRIQNLKEITPHNDSISRIGNVSAVYATKDKRFAACYGTLWNDDIAKQGSWDDWNTVVMGISDKVDMDSPCSLYELENDGSFFEISSKEVASLNTIKVIKEHKYSSYREMLKKNGVKTRTI